MTLMSFNFFQVRVDQSPTRIVACYITSSYAYSVMVLERTLLKEIEDSKRWLDIEKDDKYLEKRSCQKRTNYSNLICGFVIVL